MHVVDCLFVIVSSVLAIILGIIVNALRFLKMLQAAKCVHHRELAFQTLCQSVQNADAVCLARTWGFICSALVAMIYEKSAGKEERGVELLKHVCLWGKGLKVASMAPLV